MGIATLTTVAERCHPAGGHGGHGASRPRPELSATVVRES
jgi:hypothetical protein